MSDSPMPRWTGDGGRPHATWCPQHGKEQLETVDEVIRWNLGTDLPDSDRSVLVYAPNVDEPVWIGFHDGEQWVTAELNPYRAGEVHAWADLPAGGVPERAAVEPEDLKRP